MTATVTVRRISALILVCVVLGACTSAPNFRELTPYLTWPERAKKLASLSTWRLTGRFSISHGKDKASGGLDWRFGPDRESLAITDPLGRSVMRLRRSNQGADLLLASGETRSAADLAALLRGTAAEDLPFVSLRDWGRGIPSKAAPHRLELDAYQRAEQIKQSGWHVTYSDYGTFGAWELPRKFTVEGGTTRLRVVVTRWEPGFVGG